MPKNLLRMTAQELIDWQVGNYLDRGTVQLTANGMVLMAHDASGQIFTHSLQGYTAPEVDKIINDIYPFLI